MVMDIGRIYEREGNETWRDRIVVLLFSNMCGKYFGSITIDGE
jgi:hypothetical protein